MEITCKTCDTGTMRRKKKFRLGAFGVVFGLIFGIPSLIGLTVGAIGLRATGEGTVETSDSLAAIARSQLTEAGIDTGIIERVIDGTITDDERSNLNREQRIAVSTTKMMLSAGQVGAGIATAVVGGFSLVIFMLSAVGILLAWLITLRKKILQCDQCGAVVAAS